MAKKSEKEIARQLNRLKWNEEEIAQALGTTVEHVADLLATGSRLVDEAHVLTASELWGQGLDTYAIAISLGVKEHAVANSLASIRDAQHAPAGAAA